MTEETVPNAYARIIWAFASARACPFHHLLLMDPPHEDIKDEFVASWEPWLMEIADGELDVPVDGQAKFERHLALRLRGGRDHGWAMRFPIDALGSACEMLGAAQMFGKRKALSSLTEADLATATDAGFTLLDAGPPTIVSFFEALRNDFGTPQDKHQARYGRLYQWMARGNGSNAAFTPLRDLFRQHILDTWPLDQGETALDYRLPERRLHSIRTASKTHGLHPKRLRRLLTDAGIICDTDRPDYEVLFNAPEAQALLENASGSVSFVAAQRRLGMTRTQMERLISEGLLEPGEGGDKARPRFTEETIREWVGFFEAFPEEPKYHTLSSISETVGSLGVSTADVLRLVKQGRLSDVYRDSRKQGLVAILIEKNEASRHFHAASDKQTSTAISSVSANARISTKFLFQLADAGCFNLVEVTESRTSRPVTRIPDDALASFNEQYVSRRYLSRNGRSALAIKRKLEAGGVEPVFTSLDGKEFIYERGELTKIG